MLKEFINDYYKERERQKDKNRFYITDAGKCWRAVFFKFKKAPEQQKDGRILRIFEYGDKVHQLIMGAFFGLQALYVVAAEIYIPPQEIISGRADAIISVDNELFVVDIKSVNNISFRKMKEPKLEHIYQLQLYLYYFEIKKGILLYVDKDQQDIKEFEVEFNKKIAENLLENFKKLKSKIDENLIPSTLPDYPRSKQCRYCSFKPICKIVGKDEISWKKFREKMEFQ